MPQARSLHRRVRYSWEPALLGSAGGVRVALPVLASDTFFIINGDTLTDVDPEAVLGAHRASGSLVTLALVPNTEPDRYGGVRVERGGVVTGFAARGPAAIGTHHFIGLQVAAAKAFQSLAVGTPASTIGGLYDQLIAAQPGSVRGFVCDASFMDVGTPIDYLKTCEAFGDVVGQRSFVDPSALVSRSVLWDDVRVGAGCRLERCIMTDGVRVPARTTLKDAVLSASSNGEVLSSPLSVAHA